MSILKLKDSQGNWVGVPTVKGDTGNGISSAVLNNDYTLTLTFTDGTTYTTPSIRGEKGERGEPATDMDIHICSASEYDSETRIPIITSPDDKTFYLVPTEDGTNHDLFTEWVYVNGAWEIFGSAKIDLSGYLTDVQINGTSIVQNGVAVLPTKPENNKWGLVRIDGTYGIYALGAGNNIGKLYIDKATSSNIKDGTSNYKPIVTSNQHEATFYGLAKAAGDTTQSASSNAVGNYTDNAKDKIQTMLGVSPLIAPHESDPFESAHAIGELFIINGKLYRAKTALTAGEYINEGTNVEVVDVAEVLDGKVGDVQVNGTSIVSDGVAEIPLASGTRKGVVSATNSNGVAVNATGELYVSRATDAQIKQGTAGYRPIVPETEHMATFYGLAKASGDTTQSQSDNAVGIYTDEAKASIKNMLGVQDGMVVNATLRSGSFYSLDKTYAEIGLAVADGINVVILSEDKVFPYAGMMYFQNVPVITFGSFFAYEGKLVSNGFIVITDDDDTIAQKIQSETTIPTLNDVQVNGTSIVENGVANVPMADDTHLGAVIVNGAYGIGRFGTNGALYINYPTSAYIKSGTNNYRPIVSALQHESVFYGLAKIAGHDEKDSTLEVGTYTDEAKTAIKQMLGVHDTYDSFVEEVTGTDVTITGQPSYRYNCGEVLSLSITPPESGTIDIRFTSGSTPTVLTLPQTVKMPEWWVEVEANTIYEMCITDGIYCGVMSWAM